MVFGALKKRTEANQSLQKMRLSVAQDASGRPPAFLNLSLGRSRTVRRTLDPSFAETLRHECPPVE